MQQGFFFCFFCFFLKDENWLMFNLPLACKISHNKKENKSNFKSQ